MAGRSGAATLAPMIVGNAYPQLPKLIAANMLREWLKRKYEFEIEQMLPMSVETMAPSGVARSSSRSIWRGCMWLEPLATSSDHGSFSCDQPSSSVFHEACSERTSARRASLFA